MRLLKNHSYVVYDGDMDYIVNNKYISPIPVDCVFLSGRYTHWACISNTAKSGVSACSFKPNGFIFIIGPVGAA